MAGEMGNYVNLLFSMLLSKVVIPTEFHDQAAVVEQMIESDTTGLVDSLSMFQVETAMTNVCLDTDNEALNETLQKWFDKINVAYRGRGVVTGINGLQEEYYKELWRGASFPVLKIVDWEKIDDIYFPTKMVFVEGGSIYATIKNSEKSADLFAYDYYIGKEEKDREEIKGAAYLMYKPFVRWFAKYPRPYLVRRGVYKNWKLIDMIKNKEIELVDRVIPYIMYILKGSPELTKADVTYDAPELESVKTKIQEIADKLNQLEFPEKGRLGGKAPIRVANYDEELKHIIPDMKALFEKELFENAERCILSGMGFIDIAEAVSSSRKESVLNPKVFIKECEAGQKGFDAIIKDLIGIVKQENEKNVKYVALDWDIKRDPITGFDTDNFRTMIRALSDRGIVSNQTADLICGSNHIDYKAEVRQRIRETKRGDDYIMYPKEIQNNEKDTSNLEGLHEGLMKKERTPIDRQKGTPESKDFTASMLEEDDIISDEVALIDAEDMVLELSKKVDVKITENYIRLRQKDPKEFEQGSFKTIWISKSKNIKAVIGNLKGKSTTTVQSYLFVKDKWDAVKAKEWVTAHLSGSTTLTGAPYAEIADLPSSVRKNMDIEKQRVFLGAFNGAYNYYMKQFDGDKKKAETLAFKTAYSQVKKSSGKAKLWKSMKVFKTALGKFLGR